MNLYAELRGHYRFISKVRDAEVAGRVIAAMREAGTWPEGHDAVVREEWVLVEDRWEPM